MATITREPIGNLHEKINIRLNKEDYFPSFEKSLKQYAKNASVPGFRKGMVPSGMIRKMYGQSVFSEEVIRTASKQLEDYINKEKLDIFAQPMAVADKPLNMDMNQPGEVELSFEVGRKPEFQINTSKNLTRFKIDVSDKMIDDEVERLQRRFGKAEDVDTISEKDNIVYATFQETDVTGTPLEGAEKKEETILLDRMPVALQEQLKGKKAGDSLLIKPLDIATAEELPLFLKQSLKAGPEAAENNYELTITRVGILMPHEVNAELMLQVFQNEMITEEAPFRQRLKDELQKEFDRMSGERLNNEIFETLVHETSIPLPVAFLKRWMKEGGDKHRSEQEVESEFPNFDHSLRWQLISDKLVQDHNLNVSFEDVKSHVKAQVLGYFGMDNEDEAPWMEGYMQKMVKDEKTMNETYQRLMTDRLFSFLQTQFHITDKAVSEEEFFKLPDAHAAHHHH